MVRRSWPPNLGQPASARIVVALAGCLGALGVTTVEAADAAHPIVIELFQSQGCSSCPPANANLNALSERSDILALSFAVTYWDRLGWKDTFAKPQFTERQWEYARALHHDNVFTPQVVINGQLDGVGAERGEIEALMLRADRASSGPTVTIAGRSAEIGASDAGAKVADVWLVRFDPHTLEVAVRRGENSGKTLPHKNIVRELIRLGSWRGQAEHFDLPPAADPGLSRAILVQTVDAGPILAAAKD